MTINEYSEPINNYFIQQNENNSKNRWWEIYTMILNSISNFPEISVRYVPPLLEGKLCSERKQFLGLHESGPWSNVYAWNHFEIPQSIASITVQSPICKIRTPCKICTPSSIYMADMLYLWIHCWFISFCIFWIHLEDLWV
jgi:hypothetical protein